MDYFKHYGLLIERARNRKIQGYKEKHHVIPRCMGGSDSKENLVDLLPEEHYIAHQLLVKMYPEHPGLLSAAMMMTANRSGNKVYGWLRKRWSDKMRSNNPMRTNPSCNARKGRRLKGSYSDEERAEISSRMKKNNPMHGRKPWEHSRANEATKKIWRDADKYYLCWLTTGCSYHALATKFEMKPTMSHNNMIKLFRSGWNPTLDPIWKDFHDNPVESTFANSNTSWQSFGSCFD